MEGDSDGSKPVVKLKTDAATRSAVKTRSNSLENIKISASEIKKIIGSVENNRPLISDDKPVDHKQTSEPIPGNVEKFGGDVFGDEMEANSVFKPKRSVFRTPPSSKKIEENKNKRTRTALSPETDLDNNIKRQCDKNGIPTGAIQTENRPKNMEKTEEIINEQIGDNNISETKILEFYSALDIFADVITQQKDEVRKISLKNAHTEICKIFTLLVFRQGQMEKENIQLKNKVQTQVEIIKKIENKPQAYQNVTYAKIASFTENNNRHNDINTDSQTAEEWKTPKTSKKFETMINVQNVNNPKEAMKQLKQNVNVKEVGGAFKNIKQTKSGSIIVESHSKVQQEKLQEAVKKTDNIKAKEISINDPMFMITGIETGFSEKEFLEELIRLNNDIETELQTTVFDKIKVITKKQCRNPNKENWILQAPPTIAKWFLKKGTIYFDLLTVYVKEYFNLAMCFKCSGFDHVAKYCSGKECCHKCGKDHKSSECTESVLRCPNCVKMKLESTNHSARDARVCPVYQRRLLRYKNNINYSGDFP